MSSGYLLFDITNNAFIESRDVRLNEDEFPFHGLKRSDPLFDYELEDPSDTDYRPDKASEKIDQTSGINLQVEDRESDQPSHRAHHATSSSRTDPPTGVSRSLPELPLNPFGGTSGHKEVSTTTNSHPETGTRRSKRQRTQRDLGFYVDSSELMINAVTDNLNCASNKIPIPRSITEARSGTHATKWSLAISIRTCLTR
jgi:hypothetical protein